MCVRRILGLHNPDREIEGLILCQTPGSGNLIASWAARGGCGGAPSTQMGTRTVMGHTTSASLTASFWFLLFTAAPFGGYSPINILNRLGLHSSDLRQKTPVKPCFLGGYLGQTNQYLKSPVHPVFAGCRWPLASSGCSKCPALGGNYP